MKITTATGLIAVAVVAVMIERVAFPPEAEGTAARSEPARVSLSSSSLTGRIVSVDDLSTNPPKAGLRRAKVKLDSGETVQAWVPDACVVFPGYATRLARSFDGTRASYMVAGGPE